FQISGRFLKSWLEQRDGARGVPALDEGRCLFVDRTGGLGPCRRRKQGCKAHARAGDCWPHGGSGHNDHQHFSLYTHKRVPSATARARIGGELPAGGARAPPVEAWHRAAVYLRFLVKKRSPMTETTKP